MSNPSCPKCGQPLQKVRQSSESMLNPDQFDSVKAGDWFCECHNNNRSHSPFAYFWNKEVSQPSTPVAAQGQLVADHPYTKHHTYTGPGCAICGKEHGAGVAASQPTTDKEK